jgi:hypothetical protein
LSTRRIDHPLNLNWRQLRAIVSFLELIMTTDTGGSSSEPVALADRAEVNHVKRHIRKCQRHLARLDGHLTSAFDKALDNSDDDTDPEELQTLGEQKTQCEQAARKYSEAIGLASAKKLTEEQFAVVTTMVNEADVALNEAEPMGWPSMK